MPTPTPAEVNRQASEDTLEACKKLCAILTLVAPEEIAAIYHDSGDRDEFSTPPQIILKPKRGNYAAMSQAMTRLNELVIAGLNSSPDLE